MNMRESFLLQPKVKGIPEELVDRLLSNTQDSDEQIEAQRADVAALRESLAGKSESWAKELDNVAEALVRRSVWISAEMDGLTI